MLSFKTVEKNDFPNIPVCRFFLNFYCTSKVVLTSNENATIPPLLQAKVPTHLDEKATKQLAKVKVIRKVKHKVIKADSEKLAIF